MNLRVRDCSRLSDSSYSSLGQASEVKILLVTIVHVNRFRGMLGHSTITLTVDTYSHVISTMRGDAAAAMDAILNA